MVNAERRILLIVAAMVIGVIFGAAVEGLSFGVNPEFSIGLPVMLLPLVGLLVCGVVCAILILRFFGQYLAPAIVVSAFFLGWTSISFQLTQHPKSTLSRPYEGPISGVITAIDGRAEHRSRLWVRLDDSRFPNAVSGNVIRLSITDTLPSSAVGREMIVQARLFPPQKPLFLGSIDYGQQTRLKGIMAGGYATGPVELAVLTPQNDAQMPLSVRLTRYRYDMSAWLVAQMGKPTGGIAAALLVGDRRFIPDATYDQFRRSGLAHLLAISGLHMGLVCFGVIALLRFVFALRPSFASQYPVHKISSLLGIMVALSYVLLSGAAISAVRAFIMASLVVAAVLIDRFAITIRNVSIAAMVILLVNPAALFSAGFQLSFAATTILVLRYERRRGPSRPGYISTFFGYVWGLFVMSCLAALATAPFAAQHFGSFTMWGVVANIIAIPLTGFWIMPTGLAVMMIKPFSPELASVAASFMHSGLEFLVTLTAWFAALPYAGVRVMPPGYNLIGLGLCGWLLLLLRPSITSNSITSNSVTGNRFIGGFMIMLALGLWIVRTPPDIAILARGRPPVVVVAGNQDMAAIFGLYEWHTRLSGYFINGTAMMLGQDITTNDAVRTPKPSDKSNNMNKSAQRKSRRGVVHQDRSGNSFVVVRYRNELSAACRQDVNYVVSFAAPKYPCRSGATIIAIDSLLGGNHLIWFHQGGRWTIKSTSLEIPKDSDNP